MQLMTISEVTKIFHVTSRMLRYYDEIGLLKSIRKEDYAYRVYDEAAVRRLQQILTLRKLRIPLKKIALIFENPERIKMVEVFQERIKELDEEVSALQTIRDILRVFLMRISSAIDRNLHLDLLDDEEIMRVIQTLNLSKINFKEERSMDDLSKVGEILNKLTDKDVRILYLPPATVAASHCIGDEPEHQAAMAMDKFVLESNLPNIKPDLRQYGFNHPNPVDETGYHGYEFWVTIPDDMEVPAPLVKKHFAGGLYAAHMIPMGAFEEWGWLWNWAQNHEKYEANLPEDGGECMNGLLEEHLNYRNFVYKREDDLQLDLLIPIKERTTLK